MSILTATELKVLNNLSKALDKNVSLGDLFERLFGVSITEGTPVNAVAASGLLTLTGVVVDGETVSIGDDIYEFLADAAQSKSAVANIAVNINSYATKASGSLTMDTQPTAGDTVVIGGKTYIFVPVWTDTADGEVSIGADVAAAQANLVAAINGTDGISTANAYVRASAFASDVSTITALIGGTAGNAIATTETFTAETNVFAAATLGSGVDCSAANAVIALVAAITASDTQGVGAVVGTGTTVAFTANTKGVAGNAITTTETMTNASFGVAHLSGGVDGTVSDGANLMADSSYLYVCVNGNTISEANWRRTSLGSTF